MCILLEVLISKSHVSPFILQTISAVPAYLYSSDQTKSSDDISSGNHGHYMIFYVNQQSNAKLKFGEAESGTAQMEREEKNRNIPAYIKEMLPDGSGKTDTKQSNELQKQVHSDMPFAGGPPNRNIKPKQQQQTTTTTHTNTRHVPAD